MSCPLCGANSAQDFHQDKKRSYLRCDICKLVFVPSRFHLSQLDEKAEYDLHENDLDDQGYQQFLSHLTLPLLDRVAPNSSGLDFGCGPDSALPRLIESAGHQVALYDKYYMPDRSVLLDRYDFITVTEVVEHLKAPLEIFEQLWDMLKPKGTLGIMTKLVIDQDRFTRWHYKNDPTHICFFCETTFKWLADRLGAKLEFIGSDVIFLTKA